MPNSFTKLYIHHVSPVKYRKAMITPNIENHVYAYIGKIIKEYNQTVIAINGMPDHIHVLARLRPDMNPAKFVQLIKGNSSRYINQNKLTPVRFEWQKGGGTFSVGARDIDVETVKRYIDNQKNHHAKQSTKEEYIELLRKNDIPYESQYLPTFF